MSGFTVSPDGSWLALALAGPATHGTEAGAPSEIMVIDVHSGARTTWQGGLERAGKIFGIDNLSWTSDGRSLVFLALWCLPDDISYGIYGGFDCSSAATQPVLHVEGTEQLRAVSLASGGGLLSSGTTFPQVTAHLVLGMPVLAGSSGTGFVTITGSQGSYRVVTLSRSGAVTGDLGPVDGPGDRYALVRPDRQRVDVKF